MKNSEPPANSVRGVVLASFIGTTIEWYDFFLYGTAAALVFNQLFFPTLDPLAGTMASFATYAVGFFARPVGGDRVRALRRPDGPQVDARHDAHADGTGDVSDRRAADLRADRASPRRSCWSCCGSCRDSAWAANGAARC